MSKRIIHIELDEPLYTSSSDKLIITTSSGETTQGMILPEPDEEPYTIYLDLPNNFLSRSIKTYVEYQLQNQREYIDYYDEIYLYIRSQNLTDEELKIICEIIRTDMVDNLKKKLVKLDISDNKITIDGLKYLFDFIIDDFTNDELPSIKYLYANRNNIKREELREHNVRVPYKLADFQL